MEPGSPAADVSEGSPAALVRAARGRQGIDQAQLALRAGIHPERVAAIEAGRATPDDALLTTMLLVLGEELVGGGGRRWARPVSFDHDPLSMAEERAKTPARRLEDWFAWNRFADQLAKAGARARAGR